LEAIDATHLFNRELRSWEGAITFPETIQDFRLSGWSHFESTNSFIPSPSITSKAHSRL